MFPEELTRVFHKFPPPATHHIVWLKFSFHKNFLFPFRNTDKMQFRSQLLREIPVYTLHTSTNIPHVSFLPVISSPRTHVALYAYHQSLNFWQANSILWSHLSLNLYDSTIVPCPWKRKLVCIKSVIVKHEIGNFPFCCCCKSWKGMFWVFFFFNSIDVLYYQFKEENQMWGSIKYCLWKDLTDTSLNLSLQRRLYSNVVVCGNSLFPVMLSRS